MEAGRIGGGETRAAGRGKVGRSGAPVGRDHQYGGTTKKQSKNKTVPQKVKVGQGGPPRWSGVTVRGDTPKCGASRWSAMGVRGLTTQNHFGLDRDRPSHGSRYRPAHGGLELVSKPKCIGRQFQKTAAKTGSTQSGYRNGSQTRQASVPHAEIWPGIC